MSAKCNFGYLNYQQMLDYIAIDKINAYDMVFCYDTREWYVISTDNEPLPVRSRIYVFSSVYDANEKLNKQTDTYEGQIVAIQNGASVTAYIVTKNVEGLFSISPLSITNGDVDYNNPGDNPIINLVGTISNPINAVDLNTGIYIIQGQFTVDSTLESTIYFSEDSNLLMVTHTDSNTYIKYITANDVTDYIITESSIEKHKIITDKFLEEYCKLNFASRSHTHIASQITDLPSIPTKTSHLLNDKKFSVVTISDDNEGNINISIET